MRAFSIGNLSPSDAIYLKENLDRPEIQEQFLEQLTRYLGQHGACEQSLDNVFYAAAELGAHSDVIAQISVEKLDDVLNGRSMGIGPRTEAFVEGLGISYKGQIRLTEKQRRFT